MGYLIDTNVLSELRKGARRNPHVATWIAGTQPEELFLSVLVIGEVRRGIENIRRRDAPAAANIDAWLARVLISFGDRVLPISREIAAEWGRLSAPDPVPVIDGLLAATALIHQLTLVTRNSKDVARTGVAVLNPFEPPAITTGK